MSAHLSLSRGGSCPVVEALVGYFGEDLGMMLLWNQTCFPMSDEDAWEQAVELIDKDIASKQRAFA